jgi:hypothetical protein
MNPSVVNKRKLKKAGMGATDTGSMHCKEMANI